MHKNSVEDYQGGCALARSTGAATDETAYYSVLKALLDAAGHGLKPRVHCVMGLKNQGAGMPDGRLFTPDQIQKGEGTLRLRKLFREMTDPDDLDSWDNLTEVMNWAAETLNRVVREKSFEKFQDVNAVQNFYEPFLEEFDLEAQGLVRAIHRSLFILSLPMVPR